MTPDACAHLIQRLNERAESHPDRLAFQFLIDGTREGASLTYGELHSRCTLMARHILSQGRPGERALLLYPPGTDFIVAFLACLQAGVIAIPLPPPDLARACRALPRLQSVVRDAEASIVLTTPGIQSEIEGRIQSESLADVDQEFQKLRWINTPDINLDESEFEAAIEFPSIDEEDIAFLQYTSGSTSSPKGVMVSHANMVHQCRVLGVGAGYTDQSVSCTWMPYHHDYGLIEGLMLPLFHGVPCYFMSPVTLIRRPVRWLEAISRYRVTHSQAPNFAHDLCVRKTTAEQRAKLDLSSWEVAASAAEPVRPVTLAEFQDAFADSGFKPTALSPAYGLAEATLIVTHKPPGTKALVIRADVSAWEDGRLVPATLETDSVEVTSCGRPLDGMSVAIVDPDTAQRCDDGQVGEIWVSGPSVAQGYWNRDEETRQTFHARIADSDEGPFLRTGDLGCVRDDELFVCGRHKDLIIIRGSNHYPQDIELTVERSHPAMRPGYGAAFSIDGDEEERLVVVQEVNGKHRRNLNVDEATRAIRRAILEEHDLSLHAVILVRSGGVLKTTSGKIQRRAMKELFLNGELDEAASWRADSNSPVDPISPVGPKKNGGIAELQTRTDIEAWLKKWIASLNESEDSQVDTQTAFADCGLDSMRSVELAADLEVWLDRPIDEKVVWTFPTVAALAGHLAASASVLTDSSFSPVAGTHEKRNGTKFDSSPEATGIAIIGMGCRFPGGAGTPAEYWDLLVNGDDAVSEIPSDRWNVDCCFDSDPDTPGKMYTRHGGFISQVDDFDPVFFGITPREAGDMDPQQRLLLEVAWESLEHAGITPSTLAGSDTGVFIGASSDDHAFALRDGTGLESVDAQSTVGSARSIAAGRIAYVLNLHGPAVQIDTACSSSLMAVHQASQSLLTGECRLAMAGGVNLMLTPAMTVALCKLRALAPDGRCKAFDADADGTVRGEGCGVVVLKRMSDALRDGDRILARIRSTVANHDGASNGLTAPSPVAQQRLIEAALRKAKLGGSEVSYVEAHGTGTELGDPIELDALQLTYGHGRAKSRPLYVGTAKTNIGHLEAAAGIAGLLKAVLAIQNGQIPPSLHWNTPNRKFGWQQSAITIPTETTSWPTADGASVESTRLAAVSSFGCSGTNTHVIVESVPARAVVASAEKIVDPPRHLLTLSAKGHDALRETSDRFCRHIEKHPELTLTDICATAATAREHFPHRLAVVAASREELLAELRTWVAGEVATQVLTGDGRDSIGDVGFLFTGQGSQYVGMGRELYDSLPVFRTAIDRCDELSRSLMSVPLTRVLFADPTESEPLIDQTQYTQPALFAVEYALSELWKSWGVRPAAVLGHSVGEYAAACSAGVFSLETGLQLVAARGRLIQDLPANGEMAVVMASESHVASVINGLPVSLAAINGPASVVISGERIAVQSAVATFEADGVDTEILNTSNAGHSRLMDPVLDPFRETAEKFEYHSPQLPLISNVSGKIAGDEVASSDYWVSHIRSPVRFADGIQAMAATGCRTFLEVGPNPNLSAMGMACLRNRKLKRRWLPSLTRERSDWDTTLYSLAELYVCGVDVDWEEFYRPWPFERVTLPGYPFQRQTFLRPYANHVPADSPPSLPAEGIATTEPAMPSSRAVAADVDSDRSGLEDEARELTPRFNEVAVQFVIEAIGALGIEWSVGHEFTELDLDLQIPEENRPKILRVLSRLVDQEWLGYHGRTWRVLKSGSAVPAEDQLAELNREHPCPECEMIGRAGPALAEIWQGKVAPLTVLFPTGGTDEAAHFYSNSHLLAGYNRLARKVLHRALQSRQSDVPIRILEVGAGTGGLTTHLLPELPTGQSEFMFTDVSPLFLRAAKERFREFPFLEIGLLDIGQSTENQGFEAGTYDMIVAANVLHATPRLDRTLSNVRKLLKPGGWLMLLECAHPPVWGDMIFTLIDGWWNFEDTDLRPDYPLMQSDRWTTTLKKCGFAEVACLNDAESGDDSYHTLYLAEADLTLSMAAAVEASSEARPASSAPLPPPELRDDSNRLTSDEELSEESLPGEMTQEALQEIVCEHAARVMRMRPEEIDESQPLSDLGMDSLMAVELRTMLGHTLDIELSLNPLRMRRSVEEIAAYIFEGHTPSNLPSEESSENLDDELLNVPRVQMVPLTPTDRKLTPLFFVPAGYGDLLAFQDIANALGKDQPAYGLQPASAKRVKTIRQMSIYRLVSAYITEIRKVQPEGPYQLAGYSAGAFIALEASRELMRQGEEISLLVIFDPPTHVPFWLDWMYALGYRFFQLSHLLGFIRQTHSRFARRLFHTVLDEGLRTHTTVTSEHRVALYPGRITHFRSRLSQAGLISLKRVGRFWRKIARDGVEVHWIPGTHYGMMRGSGARVVVDELYDCLQRARTAATSKPKRESP